MHPANLVELVRTHSSMFLISFPSHVDLANLVNIAAIKAAVEGADKLNGAQLEFAKDRIIMGTERKTMFLSEDSKKVCIILTRHVKASYSIHDSDS